LSGCIAQRVSWAVRSFSGSSCLSLTTLDLRRRAAVGRLDGKVALIAGHASGLDKVAATTFAREGARVVPADVADEVGTAAVDAERRVGGEASYVHADVSQAEQPEAMAREATDRSGSLSLYDSAGIGATFVVDGGITAAYVAPE
jgi:NAD(P)-dependent dehydrogenase (short-subunit alcohol dehydrogenase family)